MNKEQVEKYGEVIKWFCDNPDKGVYWKHFNDENSYWEITYVPNWQTNCIYVQNDKQAEFRKAFAEGKSIQYKLYNKDEWKDCIPSDPVFYQISAERYRIKPDEPKFKVGDWVKSRLNQNFLIVKHNEISSHPYQLHNGNFMSADDDGWELWQPKEGEWCVFWDEKSEGFYVEPFSDEEDGLFYGKIRGESFANIAPLEFIETLKKERDESQ